jgi:hypothetical protein
MFVENSEGYINENGRLDGCEPFLVASHVSQEEMRDYYEHRSYEGTPSGHLRLMDHWSPVDCRATRQGSRADGEQVSEGTGSSRCLGLLQLFGQPYSNSR